MVHVAISNLATLIMMRNGYRWVGGEERSGEPCICTAEIRKPELLIPICFVALINVIPKLSLERQGEINPSPTNSSCLEFVTINLNGSKSK